MPLKIRCPHCQKVLIAEDAVAGQVKRCPACGAAFNVPLPRDVIAAEPQARNDGPTCPRCGAEVGPTATLCRKCHTDLRTGKRLPLRQRLQMKSWRFWMATGLITVGLTVAILTSVQLYRTWSRTAPAATTTQPIKIVQTPAAELAHDLLAGPTPADRAAAQAALGLRPKDIGDALAQEITHALAHPADVPGGDATLRAAIELLAQAVPANEAQRQAWHAVLQQCTALPALHDAAMRARGLLGDVTALEDLATLWLAQIRRELFLEAVADTAQRRDDPATRQVLIDARQTAADTGAGLRALAFQFEQPVFERLVGAYWDSWAWLGQTHGDGLARAIFDLARPEQRSLEFNPQDIRQPRDVLIGVGATAPPVTRAAAAEILSICAPQYRSAVRTICESLRPALADADPLTQQRLVWTLAQLIGRTFGNISDHHPRDVTATEIAAALAWAGAPAGTLPAAAYPGPPRLTNDASAGAYDDESKLLADLHGGWEAAAAATERWLAAGLGLTPELRAILDPGQRTPDYPALAAAFVLAAELDATSVRPELELWHEAQDQPAWVRALAYTVLGGLDARGGAWNSGWPANLKLDARDVDEPETPSLNAFARVIAAGGPTAIARLRDFRPRPLSSEMHATLLQAAQRALEQRGASPQ